MSVKLQNQFFSSQFSGAWTPSFFGFTGKLSTIQENEHNLVHWVCPIAVTDSDSFVLLSSPL